MSASELVFKTASELAGLIRNKEVSSAEVTSAHLDRINESEGAIHAFLHINDGAMDAAKAVDEKIAAGERLSELAGVPLAVKDILCTLDMPSTAASRILEGWIPPYDATVVKRSREAGLVPLGKTNLDEFAMGSSTEFSAYGPSRNPWDTDRIPGGSGGGSAAAVAAFEAPIAFGSDTGGSIRQPAAVTGTVGFKPTYGGASRFGAIALASSLDQVGPVSRNVLDAALFHDVFAGYDEKDSTSLNYEWPSMAEAARLGAKEGSLKGLRIGVVKELNGEGFQPGVKSRFNELVELATAAGAEIVEVSAPHFDYATAAYYLILPAEASSNLAKYDAVRFGLRVTPNESATIEEVMSATREAGFGPEVKRRIILGTYALSAGYYDAYYGSAQQVRTLIQRDFVNAFDKADVLISPAAPTTAFKIGERINDPMAMYLNDITTIPANMAGIPAGSIPMGITEEDGLPVGLQIMAGIKKDDLMYKVAATLEALLAEKHGGSVLDKAPRSYALKGGAK